LLETTRIKSTWFLALQRWLETPWVCWGKLIWLGIHH
jgi:hypothetical protein